MMKKKYILFSVLLFIFVFLFLGAHFALALEVKLPGLPDKPTLPEYVKYIFTFLTSVAGVLALISFTIGAVGLINPNVEAHSEAKDRMKGAVLGLILTVASYVILYTINPSQLTNISLEPLSPLPGVFYSGAGDDIPAPVSNSDVATVPKGYSNIKYTCTNNNGPTLLVWKFPGTGLESDVNNVKNAEVARVDCGQDTGIPSGSFKMAFETPGIYFHLGSGCSGYSSDAITGSQDNLGGAGGMFSGNSMFYGGIKSISIVNDYTNNNFYGTILHNTAGLENGGKCSFPIWGDGCHSNDSVVPLENIKTAAADIFTINQDTNSGTGVNFYSKPTGWNTNSGGKRAAGYFMIPNDKIKANIQSDWLETDKMCFGYTNVDVPAAYKFKCTGSTCGNKNNGPTSCPCQPPKTGQCPNPSGNPCPTQAGASSACSPTATSGQPGYCGGGMVCVNGECKVPGSEGGAGIDCGPGACETFQDCPGSIEIKGSYLVAIYSQDLIEGSIYCQTFTKTVPNLNVQGIIAAGASEVGTVYIIPTK